LEFLQMRKHLDGKWRYEVSPITCCYQKTAPLPRVCLAVWATSAVIPCPNDTCDICFRRTWLNCVQVPPFWHSS